MAPPKLLLMAQPLKHPQSASLMNIVFYGIKISSSHHELEPHDIIRVLSFMLLIITKVTVDRNEAISTVFLYFVLFVMTICLFLFQFSSRAVIFL